MARAKKPREHVLAHFSLSHADGQDEYVFMKQNGNLIVRVTINGLSHDVQAVVFCHLVFLAPKSAGLVAFAKEVERFAYA